MALAREDRAASHANLVSCDVLGRLSVGSVVDGRGSEFPSAALIASSARFGRLRIDGPMTGADARLDSVDVLGDARVLGELAPSSIGASRGAGSWSAEAVEGFDVVVSEASQSLVCVTLSSAAASKWSVNLRPPRPVALALLSCSDGKLRLSYELDEGTLRLELEGSRRRTLASVSVSVLAVFANSAST